MKNVLGILFVTMSVGCASIVSDTTGTVYITSNPSDAEYEIRNHRDMVVHKGITPNTAVLKKKRGYFKPADYTIVVTKEGYIPGTMPIGTGVSWWYAGNIIFGGLTGLLIVDPATGAMWSMEEDPPQVILHKVRSETDETEHPTDGSSSTNLPQVGDPPKSE